MQQLIDLREKVLIAQTRSHYLVDGVPFSRVTYILNEIAKPELYYWYGKHGTVKCKQIASEGRSLGLMVHKLIQRTLENKPDTIEYSQNATIRMNAFNKWAAEHTLENYVLEEPLYNTNLRVAGTADYIGDVDKELSVVDWKNSKDVYFSYPIQVAVYMQMVYAMTGIKPKKGVVLVLLEDGSYKEATFDWDTSSEMMKVFLGALKVYEGKQKEFDIDIKEN